MIELTATPSGKSQLEQGSNQTPHLSSDEWQNTFDCMPDLIAILDTEHRIVKANRAMREKLEQGGNSIIGRHCYRQVHKLDAPPDFCPHTRLLKDGNSHTKEVHLPVLLGEYSVTVTPLYDPDGKVTGSIHVAHDITGLKRAGEALRESEALYRSILTASPDNITITDLEGCIRILSPKGLAMFGYERGEEELLGRSVVEFIAPEDRERCIADLMRMVRGTFTGPGEYRALRADGSLIMIEVNGDFIIGSDNQPESMIFDIRDISERKRVEAELNKKNAELEQFIYTVSHDLRSPLVTVKTFMGYLECDLTRNDQKRVAEDMQFIHGAADKMKLMLDELMEMSRIGRVETPLVRVSYKILLTEVLDVLAGAIKERKVDIRLPDTELMLLGDRPRLCQIWQNLIENAIKYSRDGSIPCIELGWQLEGGETLFFVRDNGIGIDPRYHSKIFEIFEKLDPKSPGAGMGLSMIKRIVEKQGGRIWVESEGNGTGSCFRFTLPEAVHIE